MTQPYAVRLRAIFLALVTLVIASSSLMAQWSDLPALPEARTWTQQAILNGKLYAFGGMNSAGAPAKEAWVLDLSNLASGWQAIADMPETRGGGFATAYNGKILIAGGVGVDAAVAGRGPVLEYDVTTGNYTPKAPIATPSWFSGYTLANGKIYAVGGLARVANNNTPINTTQIYDIATDIWSYGPNVPSLYYYGNAATIGNDVYYFGGLNRSGNNLLVNASTIKLVNGTGTWQSVAGQMNKAVYSAAAGVLNGKIYVAGGIDVNGAVSSSQVFDPATSRWTAYYPLGQDNSNTNVMPSDGTALYLVGGTDGKAQKLTIGAARAIAVVSPTAVNIAAKAGSTRSKPFTISNNGIIPLTGTVELPSSAPWLSVGTTTINITPGASDEFVLTADAAALAVGVYNAIVNVRTNDADNATIPVNVRLYVVENLIEQPTHVVIEEATGSWCPPCGSTGTPTMRGLQSQYGESLIVIAYHDRGGRPVEPMATATTEAMTRRLGVPYWPAAAVQRIDWPEEAGLMTGTDTWDGHIRQVLMTTPIAPAALEVNNYAYNPTTKRVTASIKVTTADAIAYANSTLVLTAVVVEDSILYEQAGTTESPYYHMHVARSFWPNITGQTIQLPTGATAESGTILLPGKEMTVDVNFPVTGVLVPKNAHIVWIVSLNEGANPGEILQGKEMKLIASSSSGGGNIITVTPDAASKNIGVGQTAVFNTVVTNVTDAPIEVTVDRMTNTLPNGNWSSQLCINDDCLPTSTNRVATTVTPGQSVTFRVKIVGGSENAQGVVGIKVTAGDTSVSQTYTANTGMSGVESETGSDAFFAVSAYPNPVSGSARVEFTIPTVSTVSLDLFATTGEKVMTLLNARREAGVHGVSVDLSTVPAGVYSIVLSTGGRSISRTITVVR